MPKKDLAMMLMTYGNVYVARVAMGANPNQTVKAFMEAENYPGASIIIAYSPCIAHGIDMARQLESQKQAVNSGHWVLCRFNPQRLMMGENPLQLDSRPPSIEVENYIYNQIRYKALKLSKPERAQELLELARDDIKTRFNVYEQLTRLNFDFKKP